MIYTNTDGILDKCECGAHAGLETESRTFRVRAGCADCGDRTDYHEHWGLAAIQWNILQRKQKGIIKVGTLRDRKEADYRVAGLGPSKSGLVHSSTRSALAGLTPQQSYVLSLCVNRLSGGKNIKTRV